MANQASKTIDQRMIQVRNARLEGMQYGSNYIYRTGGNWPG